MKKCLVKLIWNKTETEEESCEYIVMNLDLNKDREYSIYSQIYNYMNSNGAGPTFDKYDWQEITI